jgi:hypothetical protein
MMNESINNSFEARSTGSTKEYQHKASRGIYPGIAPFGYWKNVDGVVEIDPVESQIAVRIFELRADGKPSLRSIVAAIIYEFGIPISESTVYAILHDYFYLGIFKWETRWYIGVHRALIHHNLFYKAHAIRNKYD